MKLRRLGRSLGWALAYFVGNGLLFLGCVAVLAGWAGGAVPPAVFLTLTAGVPILFASVAIVHEFTGKLARTNHALRKTTLFVLWPLAFYLATFVLLVLSISLVPRIGSLLDALILAPALAGGVAGSLCWSGKLPGTR